MAWIVNGRGDAERAGAHMVEDEVMFAVTPATLGETYNNHMAARENGEEGRDYWGELSDGGRERYVEDAQLYIYKHAWHFSEGLQDTIQNTEKEAARGK